MLIVAGDVVFDGERFAENELAKFELDSTLTQVQIDAKAGTHLVFLGGEPLPYKVLLWWNFVSDSKAGLEKAIMDWNNHHPRFGQIDTTMPRLTAPPLPEGFKE